ncbi:MAG: hypothetical protein J6A59_16995 [Lachnospiraceae bacterium]|nr:hypothetical protein [Lachnospiraceae bacterium]
MASLKYRNFIKIKQGTKDYFGGDQSWWKNEDETMCEVGCGVIALCNMELYVDGVSRKGISYDDYKVYVDKRHKEAYPIKEGANLRRLGLLPLVMERGLDKFYNDIGVDPVISWCPTISKKRIRTFLENMLDNNIPVVASYYVFNKKNKLDLYSYNEKTKDFDKVSGIRRHYFNIVGITRRQGRDLLVISTWGERYYADYKQWVKKLSLFSNILYVE